MAGRNLDLSEVYSVIIFLSAAVPRNRLRASLAGTSSTKPFNLKRGKGLNGGEERMYQIVGLLHKSNDTNYKCQVALYSNDKDLNKAHAS